jgi:hypothetical protein
MTPDHKKPTAGFWITVALVAVLVGYPLSFGPACWLTRREVLPFRPTAHFYGPIIEVASTGPGWIRVAVGWYSGPAKNYDMLESMFVQLRIDDIQNRSLRRRE